uniref:sigma factor n=1 Tax=Nonomuraea sp. CA-252377 TaxID=3240003 RepID=UPI003F49A414
MDDEPGFDDFVAEHTDALLRYGYVLSGNPHDAADLVQEALVRLCGAWPRVRRKDNPHKLHPDHDGTVAHQRLAAAPA